jgi:hypothetical protein
MYVEKRRKRETHACACMWRRGEKEKHTRVLARLALTGRAGRGEPMGTGARRARESSAEIRPKASHVCSLLLLFIFATSPCLIRFDRDKPSQLRDTVT